MDAPHADRRHVLLGLAATGFALGAPEAEAAQPGPGKSNGPAPLAPPDRTAFGMQHSMRPCRFGAMHYRFVRPSGAPAHTTSRTPTLCLHASPSSGLSFAQFLPLLGTDRLVIAPDNPGFGLSDRPEQAPTIADFAGAIWDLVDDLGLRRVNLIGTSTGASTAAEMALQRPRGVERIVLESPPLLTVAEIAGYKAALKGTVPPNEDAAAQSIPGRWKDFAPFREGMSDALAWQMFWEMNRDPTHRGWGHDAAFDYDIGKTLRRLPHPILVLSPNNRHAPISARARGLAPGIDVMDLPWAGSPFTTEVAEGLRVIRGFLDA